MTSFLDDLTHVVREIFGNFCIPLQVFEGDSTGTSITHPSIHHAKYLDLRHLRSYAIDSRITKVVDDAIALDSEDENAYWVFIADATYHIKVGSIKTDCPTRRIDRVLIDQHLSLGASEFTGSVLGYKFKNGLQNPVQIILAFIKKPIRYTHEEVAKKLSENSEQGSELRKLLCFAEVSNEKCCRHASEKDISKLVQMFMSATCKFAGKFAKDNHIPFIYRTQEERDLTGTFSSSPRKHAILETDSYAQVTSPLRRWGDTINHFQLVAHLHNEDLPYSRENLELEVELLKRKIRGYRSRGGS